MRRFWVVLVMMTMVLGSAAHALAQPPWTAMHGGMGWGHGMTGFGPGMMGMGPGMMGMGPGMMGFGITLTEEQRKRLTDLHVRFLLDRAKVRGELIRARAALQVLLFDPSAKDEAIETQVGKVASVYGRLFLLHFRMMRQTQGVLTKEQREEMMRRFYPGQRRMRPGLGPMGPGGGGMMPGGRMPGR